VVDKMSWEECRSITDLIRAQAGMLGQLPLEELRKFLSLASSAGAVMDPTGYRTHHRSIDAAIRIVSATQSWIRSVGEAVQD